MKFFQTLLKRFKRKPKLELIIVGQEFLDHYLEHYEDFQRLFFLEYRKNSDPLYWGSRNLSDISRVSDWSNTKYGKVPEPIRIQWWTIDDNGNSIKRDAGTNSYVNFTKRTYPPVSDV